MYAINERLSHNSSDKVVFNSTKVEYEDALKKSGHKVNLKYTGKTDTIMQLQKER